MTWTFDASPLAIAATAAALNAAGKPYELS
jgi:hypothetical protein